MTVSGVDRIRPTGPHSQAQKAAAINRARGELPVLWPKSRGSMTLAVTSSRARKKAKTPSGNPQPGRIATVKKNSSPAPSQVPT